MEQTLKITNVLSDPTRFSIYQYIANQHSEVTVQEIADNFNIHPNVARLHLSKLEDVKMIVSETKKTGKGGRPSRIYRLSDDVVQLNFPYRDYQLLSEIAINTLLSLGEVGKKALMETGHKFGKEIMEKEYRKSGQPLTFSEKLNYLKDAANLLGFYPEFETNEDQTKVYFKIFNCPFKEVVAQDQEICKMHLAFLEGMFKSLFKNVELIEEDNMFKGCSSCNYLALIHEN
ncbi:helix-turn-helix transcriptional regulator [Calidifontibacillus erzurumensis]|uniref:Helix-turn-helix domain-containing protein n=1 Tax=Calidifontibacillus erzurumensis TaxID=2741433 RepID=A0A8J8KA17_9BACI|nr:helix-turn-helix domain-containing protein [Calidifontibacillus erzurumensis]NSL50349.1 helix-turn-helix domain-containing protein [Calidifontibacillus erzurumensis]